MSKLRRPFTGLIWLTGLIALAIVAPSGADSGNKFPNEPASKDCGGGDAIKFDGAKKLWPPNHKYRDVSITAVADKATDHVTLKTTASSSEADDAIGSGHTGDDATPTERSSEGDGSAGPNTHSLRAERSGMSRLSGGRTYTLTATATFSDNPQPCMETYSIKVPHDMGQNGGQ